MIDTHCHLNYEPLSADTSRVLTKAAEAGVSGIIVPGTSRESSESAVELATSYPTIWAGVGVHPSDAPDTTPADIERLHTLIQNPKVVAVGEVGLDYFHLKDAPEEDLEAQKLLQKGLLFQMIDLAREYQKPLIIHSRDCFSDLYDVLKTEAAGLAAVIHCFSGTQQEANQWLDLGFHLSFTGIVTYKSAGEVREVAARVPRDRFMIETDAPYLAPQAFRGQTCEPAMVVEVVKVLAEVRGCSVEDIDEQTTATAQSFFKLSL